MALTLVTIQRSTAADFTTLNPTLGLNIQGYETDTGKWKAGTGTTPWATLPYSIDYNMKELVSASAGSIAEAIAANDAVDNFTYALVGAGVSDATVATIIASPLTSAALNAIYVLTADLGARSVVVANGAVAPAGLPNGTIIIELAI